MGAALYVISGFLAATAYQSSITHYDSPWGLLVLASGVAAFAGACFDFNFKV